MPDEPTGTPVEGTPAAPEAPSGDAFAPVLDRVNELASNIDTRFAAFEQRLPQPEAEPEPENPWDALFGQEEQPEYEQQPQQPALDPQALQSAFQQAVQQANAPLLQQLQTIEAERSAERLGRMIPSLADKPENAENRQRAFELVTQSLQAYPSQIANQLAADPNYIATQWKAAEADRLAAGQAPASGAVPAVEAAGGALPGGNGEQLNPVHQAFQNVSALPKGFR
jgi:hypothetical protein